MIPTNTTLSNSIPFYGDHWHQICQRVTNISLTIFPHIKGKKLKSEILSNLFETQSAEYFNSIGLNTESATSDKDPDLFFLDTEKPCEIKVTGIDHPFTKKCKWMGGKYSKRTSDFIFIVWNYQEARNTLYGDQSESLYISVLNCYVDENEWKTIDNGNQNYYATVFESSDIITREHKHLVGNHNGEEFILREYKKQ